MTLVVVLLAYLIGSVLFGVLYSRLRGQDIRRHDAPGGSGIYRRYGFGAAVLVTVLDVLKGVLALWIALVVTHDLSSLPWAILAVVLGHNYPVFFGFRGGAGIATGMGALLVASPWDVFALLGLAGVIGLLYRGRVQRRVGLNVVPFASLAALLILLGVSVARGEGFWELLAFALGMGVRSLHLLLSSRATPPESV